MRADMNGKKEVIEAVAIAALSALAAGVVNWILDESKKRAKEVAEAKKWAE